MPVSQNSLPFVLPLTDGEPQSSPGTKVATIDALIQRFVIVNTDPVRICDVSANRVLSLWHTAREFRSATLFDQWLCLARRALPSPRKLVEAEATETTSSAQRFAVDFKEGRLPGLPLQVVLLADLYRLYDAWCARRRERREPLPRLSAALTKGCGLRTARKRYIEAGVQKGPHLFVLATVADATLDRVALGDAMLAFRAAASTYGASAHA